MCKQTSFYNGLRLVFRASVVINLLLVIAIVVLFIVRQKLHEHDTFTGVTATPMIHARTDTAGQICLTCDLQGNDTRDTLYEFIVKTEHNDTLCCLQRDDDLQNLVLELMEENQHNYWHTNPKNTISEKLRWLTERNYAAHLYPSFFPNDHNLSWSHNIGIKTSMLRNLTLIDDGRKLTVPNRPGAGMYFVYALHTFDFSKASTDRPAPIGVHNIYKHRSGLINGAPKRLWTAKFGGDNTSKRQTSFLCGVVRMNMLDSIESQVCSYVPGEECTMKHMDRSPYNNFLVCLNSSSWCD